MGVTDPAGTSSVPTLSCPQSLSHDPSPAHHRLNVPPRCPLAQWIKRDLARVDRCTTPWLVVGMHRPMYVVFPHKSNRIVGEHLR